MNTTQHLADRACPVCGDRASVKFSDERVDEKRIDGFTYASRKQPEFMCLRMVRCLGCDLVYAPAPPSIDFLSTAYSEAAYDSGPEALAAANSYGKALAPHMASLRNKQAGVDVGAGSGPLLPWLQRFGFNPVIGIEPSQAAIDAATPDIKPHLRKGMFSDAMLADTQSSLICSFMTLEHISDPGEFVGKAYKLLEPGGMIAVVVHNWRAPLNRLLGMRSPIIDIEHLQLFSPKSLDTLLRGAGFESVRILGISNAYPLRYWLRLTPLPSGLKRAISSVLERVGLANILIPMRVGNILAVGTKPMEHQ